MRSLRSLLRLFLLALVVAPALLGCHRAVGRAHVVASVFPVYDLVRRIAGPDADVSLVGAAKSAEGQVATAEANLVVEVGLGLDAWLDGAAPPKARVLRVGDRVPTIAAKDGAIDPHVWMDPQRARLIVTAIAEELARTDASHANAFRARAATVDAALAALDHELDARAAAWKTRTVASDDAGMAYFGERYRVEVLGPNAANPGVPRATLDSMGGRPGVDSYEALLRADTAALDAALR